MSEKPQAEQLSGNVVCEWLSLPHVKDERMPGHSVCLRARPAQPQAPAPSLDARGDLDETEIAGLEVGLSMPSAQFATVNEYARRLLAEVKRRRAAPSAPSDALRLALQPVADRAADYDHWTDATRPSYWLPPIEVLRAARAALAAYPSVTREQEIIAAWINGCLAGREAAALRMDAFGCVDFGSAIRSLPAPTAPKEPK